MRRNVLAAALSLALVTPNTLAHEGPPFPVAVDQHAGPYTISVWTDPDVGTGTFFIVFDPPVRDASGHMRVFVQVRPTTGRLPSARYEARLQPDATFRAEVPFDREERWTVRVDVNGARGEGTLSFGVDVTPPGYGRWDLVIYLAPFVLLGGLWIAVSMKRRRLIAARTKRVR
jgi:hypothetical protein